MKLLIDGSNIISGGGLTHLKELTRHAEPAKYGFKSVQLWSSDETLKQIEEKEWLVKKSHSLLNKGYVSRLIWKYTLLKKTLSDIDLIFIPGTGYISSKCKVVTMCRNLLPLEKEELDRFYPGKIWFRLRLLRFLHLRSFEKADGVIFLNKYCYLKTKELTERILNYKIVPHGVNEEFKIQRENYEFHGSFKLLYVSTLDLYKHQWLIAKAVLKLRRKGYPISLMLIGEALADTEEKLYDVLNMYDEEREHVNWLGKVSYENLYQYYREADAYIYGSTCETFGMTLLEAMAAALPIACSNKSSMKNLLNGAGIYFDPENVPSIENAILTLFNDHELRKKVGKRAYNLAENYNWETTAHKTFQYLSDIATC